MTDYEVKVLSKVPVQVLADLYNALNDVRSLPLKGRGWTRNERSAAEDMQLKILDILFPNLEPIDMTRRYTISVTQGMWALWDDNEDNDRANFLSRKRKEDNNE